MRVRSPPGTGRIAVLALGGLLAAASLPAASTPTPLPDPAPGDAAPADTVRATVYRADAEAGTVDVLGGVGFALRLTRVRTVAETSVYVGDEPAGIGAIRRGQLVEIEFWEDPEGYGEDVPGPVARSIHVVASPNDGTGR